MSRDRRTAEPPGSRPASELIWHLLTYIANLERRYQALWREHNALLAALWGNDPRTSVTASRRRVAGHPTPVRIIVRADADDQCDEGFR